MRVFVTGATGFIGSAIVQELLNAGHQVTGLARSEKSAAALKAAGVAVHYGTLSDPQSLASGAAAADGVIHTAFNHEFIDFQKDCAIDQAAIAAMGQALLGSGRPLVVTSGTAILPSGTLATEEMKVELHDASHPRAASEQALLGLAEQRVRAMVIRLPPTVHGEGDHGFVPMLIELARTKGLSAYIAQGENRWPAVHRFDAARLYRLALEQGVAGARYHAVAEQGIAMKSIAEAIGQHLSLPVISKTGEAAADHFGWLGAFAAKDNLSSSEMTRRALGWTPESPGLLHDLQHAGYFA